MLRYEFPANPLVQTLSQAQAIAQALLRVGKKTRAATSRSSGEVTWR